MMLLNTQTQHYHNIIYTQRLFPGGFGAPINETVVRFKSYGHSTVGYADKEVAAADAYETADKLDSTGLYRSLVDIEAVGEWDGIETPASIFMLSNDDIDRLVKERDERKAKQFNAA